MLSPFHEDGRGVYHWCFRLSNYPFVTGTQPHIAATYSPGLYGGKHGEERTARSTGSPQDGRGDHDRPRRLSGHPVTQPYQRWLGTTPSSRYAILIRLR